MYFLVYSSTASECFNESQLNQILSSSTKNNQPLDITGILLFHNGSFIQLLEGPKENVEQLVEKIGQDNRHRNMITLYKGISDKRYFPKWSMAFETLSENTISDMQAYESLEQASDFLASAEFDHAGLKLLRYFYEMKK